MNDKVSDPLRAREREREYESLSPFELKNKLIELATDHQDRTMLNAGRGNPNWLAHEPRHAFCQLHLFALAEAERSSNHDSFARSPTSDGIVERFKQFLQSNGESSGVPFLSKSLSYCENQLGLDAQALVFELCDAILGDHYPVPDRMLRQCEVIVHAYLDLEMCGGSANGKFDLFATEGGTAAMSYIFNSLKENGLLNLGDKIALGTPIFTPYLEIPHLNDYELMELEIAQSEDADWQYPDEELEKLKDPTIKAFFVVNPANPSSVAMHPDSIAKIANIIDHHRPDLLLLTDDVYGTFVEDFRSLASACPRNTILVYSYSKYFGATGWRLGVIGIHEDNVFDQKIANLDDAIRDNLRERYSTVVLDPDAMKLIDRMVADSRTVALNHTAGLSTPQQVMMTLFSLAGLLDARSGSSYKHAMWDVVCNRYKRLFDALGEPVEVNRYNACYYVDIDIPRLARSRYGDAFANYLFNEHEHIDFVWRLAMEKSVVLMDGGGFDAPEMSVRVSLANLEDEAYDKIGKSISELLAEYYEQWQPDK
ncbi:MAG: bifunctional aspartate transaminase/aspartate 4-decarboxylase [Pseudomonadota bacterium]